MKKHFSLGFAALLFAATFSACSSDEDATETEQTSGAKAITFTTLSDMSKETRATATTPTNATTEVTNFKVWAYYNNNAADTYYMGTAGEGGLILDRDNANTSTWNHRTASDLHYWPTGSESLNFYALTPAENTNYSFNSEALTYTIPTANADQKDVMVAQANDQTYSNSQNGKVTLTFSHILSQIAFMAKTASSDLSVDVNGITIHNVKNGLTYNLKSNAATATSNTNENYAIGMAASPVTVNSTSNSTNLTADNGVLLLAPQTITGWSTTTNAPTSITDANTASQGYLEISCKIKSGDVYLLGSADNYATTYVPFSATWEAGKKYVYTLVFGGGKKEDGTDQFQPITFTVDVQDWNTDAANNSDINL